jgi:hypothetical protein
LEEAPSRIPAGSGIPGIRIAEFAAEKLAAVYEDFTEEKFHVSGKRGQDAPARFVECGLRTIAPEVTDANIQTALRPAVKVLIWRRRNQKPPRKRE